MHHGGYHHQLYHSNQMFTCATTLRHIWCHFHLHMSHKAAKSKTNLSASRVVNYTLLFACQGDTEAFKGYPSTSGYLTSLRINPQQKHPGDFQH